MLGKRRQFSREFKLEAVRLLAESGRPLTHIDRDSRSGRSSCVRAGGNWGTPNRVRPPGPTRGNCAGCGASSKLPARSGTSQKRRRRSSRESPGEVRLHRAAPGRVPGHTDVSGARRFAHGILRLAPTAAERPMPHGRAVARRDPCHSRREPAVVRQPPDPPRAPGAGAAARPELIAPLMRLEGLRAKRSRRYRATTQSDATRPAAPNTLGRRFAVRELNRVWAGDVTACWTGEGWLYLAALLDLGSRRVVGWATSATLDQTLTQTALRRPWRSGSPRRVCCITPIAGRTTPARPTKPRSPRISTAGTIGGAGTQRWTT